MKGCLVVTEERGEDRSDVWRLKLISSIVTFESETVIDVLVVTPLIVRLISAVPGDIPTALRPLSPTLTTLSTLVLLDVTLPITSGVMVAV